MDAGRRAGGRCGGGVPCGRECAGRTLLRWTRGERRLAGRGPREDRHRSRGSAGGQPSRPRGRRPSAPRRVSLAGRRSGPACSRGTAAGSPKTGAASASRPRLRAAAAWRGAGLPARHGLQRGEDCPEDSSFGKHWTGGLTARVGAPVNGIGLYLLGGAGVTQVALGSRVHGMRAPRVQRGRHASGLRPRHAGAPQHACGLGGRRRGREAPGPAPGPSRGAVAYRVRDRRGPDRLRSEPGRGADDNRHRGSPPTTWS